MCVEQNAHRTRDSPLGEVIGLGNGRTAAGDGSLAYRLKGRRIPLTEYGLIDKKGHNV